MTKRKKISFVIPLYNEAGNVKTLIKQLKKFFSSHKQYFFEAILVENGSSDETFTLLKKFTQQQKNLKILQLSKNFGCDGGIAAGLEFVKADAAVIMMADLQEPIELVNVFINHWEKGYKIVYGVVKKRPTGILNRYSSETYYHLLNFLSGQQFPPNASDFRLIDQQVVTTLNQFKEQNKYLRGLIIWTGFSHLGVPFVRKKRLAEKSKSNLKTLFFVAFNGIFSFSYFPLRFISILGIILTLIAFLLAGFYLGLFFYLGRVVPGFTTLTMLMLFLFGMLFFVLGIISEYLARIYEEVKQRPRYIVKSTQGLKI